LFSPFYVFSSLASYSPCGRLEQYGAQIKSFIFWQESRGRKTAALAGKIDLQKTAMKNS
jgi:hypothetical protein